MITIKDVAKLAGVSISTVSIVLNGTRKLSPATEAKVRKAIETLQYHPNQYARSLVTKHKKVVGVIRIVDEERDDHSQDLYASTVDTYLQDMLWNIEEVIRLHGSSMVLGWYDALAPEQIPSILDPSRVDGIICVGSFISAQLIAAVKRSGLAAVLVGARDAAFDFVDADVERAFQLSASSMLQRGRRRLLLLNGPGNSQSSQRREAGFLQAVAMAGAEGRTCNCQFSGKSAEEVCLGMIPTFKPDAIIAGADCMAVGALNAMRRLHLSCPEDISVMGYEDGLLAQYSVPPLSTVRIHKGRIGTEGAMLLFDRIGNPSAPPVQKIVEPELLFRSSTD